MGTELGGYDESERRMIDYVVAELEKERDWLIEELDHLEGEFYAEWVMAYRSGATNMNSRDYRLSTALTDMVDNG